jgi:hypothetical protein
MLESAVVVFERYYITFFVWFSSLFFEFVSLLLCASCNESGKFAIYSQFQTIFFSTQLNSNQWWMKQVKFIYDEWEKTRLLSDFIDTVEINQKEEMSTIGISTFFLYIKCMQVLFHSTAVVGKWCVMKESWKL